MGKLNLSFVIFKGTLKLCVQVADTDIRHRETIKGLINPNLSSWDKKKQCFCEATETAIHNNTVLSQTMSMYQTLLEHREFANGKELFAYAKVVQNVKAEANTTPTFGGFLEELIKEMRGEQKKKRVEL